MANTRAWHQENGTYVSDMFPGYFFKRNLVANTWDVFYEGMLVQSCQTFSSAKSWITRDSM